MKLQYVARFGKTSLDWSVGPENGKSIFRLVKVTCQNQLENRWIRLVQMIGKQKKKKFKWLSTFPLILSMMLFLLLNFDFFKVEMLFCLFIILIITIYMFCSFVIEKYYCNNYWLLNIILCKLIRYRTLEGN